MPQTPVYGFEYEAPGEQPGRTLTGEGGSPVTPEQVEDELVRVDGAIVDLQTAVAIGWTFIDSGSESANFTIDLTAGGTYPAGTFELIRVYFRGTLTSDGVRLNVRVNSDTTASLHRSVRMVEDPNQSSNSNVVDSSALDGTTWPIAEWSTATANLAELLIFNTGVSSLLGFQSVGTRAGATANKRIYRSSGDLVSGRLLDSLQVFPVSGSVTSCRWWAEGLRTG